MSVVSKTGAFIVRNRAFVARTVIYIGVLYAADAAVNALVHRNA
jgi:hypothetical protein